MSKWNGRLEDIVIWKNAHNYRIQVTSTGTVDLPERAPSRRKRLACAVKS